MNKNSECYYTQLIKPKNTVLLVEPRRILYTFVVLKNAYDILKDDNWTDDNWKEDITL